MLGHSADQPTYLGIGFLQNPELLSRDIATVEGKID